MARKVSIYDVARYAKVSPASVSYVLNGVDKVGSETRKKVLAAIKDLGYTRSQNAVSLSTGRSNLIALFLPWDDLTIAFAENPFYGEFIGAFENEIDPYGYELIIEPETKAKGFVEWALSRNLDAVVVLGRFPEPLYKGVKKVRIPTVLVDIYGNHAEEFSNVRGNDEEACFQATNHLLSLGHKNVAFVSGDIENSDLDKKRYQGYRKAMEKAGLKEKIRTFPTEVTFNAGRAIATKILQEKEVTAAVVDADILAIGIVKAYAELGKKLPEDLSIVGFDDIKAAYYISPSLTTMRQDIAEKGRIAARMLLEDLSKKEISVRTEVLPAELILRHSTKPFVG